MTMHVHEEVLRAANQVAGQRDDWTFTPSEVVKALPVLNESSVRTDIVSRCCINAPKNHLRRWDYFRRVERGRYEVLPKYRGTTASSKVALAGAVRSVVSKNSQEGGPRHPVRRDVIHAVIHADQDTCTAECLEVAVVTQGSTLDEVVRNLNDALALHLEGEDLAALGLSDHPRVQLIFETPISL
jgi:hypothetical protein